MLRSAPFGSTFSSLKNQVIMKSLLPRVFVFLVCSLLISLGRAQIGQSTGVDVYTDLGGGNYGKTRGDLFQDGTYVPSIRSSDGKIGPGNAITDQATLAAISGRPVQLLNLYLQFANIAGSDFSKNFGRSTSSYQIEGVPYVIVTALGVAAPTIVSQPLSLTLPAGTPAFFSVIAGGTGPFTYQWFRGTTAITGETGSSLLVPSISSAVAGDYTVVVKTATGSVTSAVAKLTVTAVGGGTGGTGGSTTAGSSLKPINVSTLTLCPVGGAVTAGFVLEGEGSQLVLIRAVGPTLAALGVGGVLANPKLTVNKGAAVIGTNDDWSSDATRTPILTGAFTAAGAFALPAGSKDAAVLLTLEAGAYTAQAASVDATASGQVILEVYILKP